MGCEMPVEATSGLLKYQRKHPKNLKPLKHKVKPYKPTFPEAPKHRILKNEAGPGHSDSSMIGSKRYIPQA